MQTASHQVTPAHRATRKPVLIGLDPGAPEGDHSALALRYALSTAPARRVTIALDAFPEWHVPLSQPCQTEADYWAGKVREHIKVLQAALLLHKQITSGITVPRSLSYALNAMQVEAARRIRTALRRHVTNGGLQEAELRQAWEQAA